VPDLLRQCLLYWDKIEWPKNNLIALGIGPDEDFLVSREDLILSKLVWARDSGSEMQLRDVRTLIDESVDWSYLKDWAAKLGVAAKLDEVSK
jgi:hypothetical protein